MFTTASIYLALILVLVVVILLVLIFKYSQLKKRLSEAESACKTDIGSVSSKFKETKFFLDLSAGLDHVSEIREALDILVAKLPETVAYDAVGYVVFDGVKITNKIQLLTGLPRIALDDLSSKSFKEFNNGFNKEIDLGYVQEILVGKTLNNDNTKLLNSYQFTQIYLGDNFVGVLALGSIERGIYSENTEALVKSAVSMATSTVSSVKKILQKEQNTLTMILSNLSEGVVVLNKDLTLDFVNATTAEIIGAKNTNDVSFYDLSASFSTKFNLEQKINQVYENSKMLIFEDINLGEKFVKIVLLPIIFGKEVQSVAIIIYDLTKEIEFKRLETEFTAMIVHELRSPLTVIRGTTDMIVKNIETITHEQITNMLTQMKSSSENMLGLVNDLLDTAKAEVGKLQLVKNFYDLNAIIDERILYYLSSANERSISLSSNLDKSIGQLNLDETKMKQVLNNLLSNALKFTEKGGSILITTRRDHGFIEVVVSDTGKGIPDDAKAKLFSKFMQFKQKNTSEKGTGLGLVITKGIIETHGGRIWVEDNVPNGTKFIFTLPLH